MAHERVRSTRQLYEKLIKATPILGIFGHRQVGKTTFINQVTSHYLTFDSQFSRHSAESDPEKFIKSLKGSPFGIDECQVIPELFPALKEHVRKNKQPGQFILSGSVRFTSRKAIRESLTGRMLFFELHPLVISELDQRVLPDFFIECLKWKGFSADLFEDMDQKTFLKREKSISLYLKKGGLPGICFLREPSLMITQIDDLHRLMLDRDLRMVHETRLSLELLMNFLKLIASFGWKGYSAAVVKKKLGLSPSTQKALLFGFESIFLIRRIPIIGGGHGEIILLEDQFEEVALSEFSYSLQDQLTSLIYRNLRAQFSYRLGVPFNLKSYWTRNNARVPLVISREGQNLGVMAIEDEELSLSQIRAAESYLKSENNSKVIIVSNSLRRSKVVNSRIAIVPIGLTV